MVAPINEVPYHDKFTVGNSTSSSQKVLDIVELSVNISSKIDRRVNTDNVAFFSKNCFNLIAETSDSRLSDRPAVDGRLVPLLDVHQIYSKIVIVTDFINRMYQRLF